jgi:hypothetical protein
MSNEQQRALVDRTSHLHNRHHTHVLLRRVLWLVAAVAATILTGCKPGVYDVRMRQDTPEENAAAEKVYAAADKLFKDNQLAYERGAAENQVYASTVPQIVAAKNAALLDETRAQSLAVVAAANANAEARISTGRAAERVITALGVTLSAVIGGTALYLMTLMSIYAWSAMRRAQIAQVWTVTALIGQTRVTYLLLADGQGNVSIQNALTDGRSQISKPQRANGELARLLLEPAHTTAAALQPAREGVLTSAWHWMFGQRAPRAPAARQVQAEIMPPTAKSKVEVNL